MTEEEYIQNGAGECPECGSGDIEGDSVDIVMMQATQQVSCINCDAEWEDVYELSSLRIITKGREV
jgi:mannose-1-phosphate guanylyltransferase